MAEAVVSMVLETLRNLLIEEVGFLTGVCSQVKELEMQLAEMKCLAEDAERRKFESKTVANWISQIRYLAHRAEDTIETYAYHVSSKRSGRSFKRLLRRLACVLSDSSTLHQIASEISEIKSEFATVMGSMKDYGIRSIVQGEGSTSNDNQRWKRQTFPFEIEDCFVGKDEDLNRLVSFVVDDKEEHRFISVWGMGGIGKTTIARKVFNHSEIKRTFESFAWVCITQECRIRSTLEDVIKKLISGEDRGENLISSKEKEAIFSNLHDSELIEQLINVQRKKRCIVVFDDIWDIEHWNCLKQAFVVQGLNSKVLITTRNKYIADKGFEFEIGLLSKDDGWELLRKKAFQHNNVQGLAMEEKSFEQIGKEMMHKCGYLPLAISLLGGVLSKKESITEWVSVNENMSAYLYKGEGIEKEKEIHGVLNLSYEELPYYLKPCFLYLGQFKEDQQIPTGELYKLWIAEGMISPHNLGTCETLMDVAELYLDELASRCIVQVCVDDFVIQEKYKSCQLHDVVRQLCMSKGKSEDFSLQVFNYRGGSLGNLLSESLSGRKARHLAVYFEKEIEIEHEGCIIPEKNTSSIVRSLRLLKNTDEFPSQIKIPCDMFDFHRFKLLKTLVIKGFEFPRRKLPTEIGDLIHLRHLWLEDCKLDEVPSSIRKLVFLITLCLDGCCNVRIPNVLQKLVRLRYLYLPNYTYIEKIGDYRLALDGLDELEMLQGFDSMVHDLTCVTKMKKLTHLSAEVNDNKSMSNIISAIKHNWERLHSCVLWINDGCDLASDEEKGITILNNMFACSTLREVIISTRLGNILEKSRPQIIASRLTTLALSECQIEDDPMEMLGKLPLLEELHFYQDSFVGEEMRCHASSFPKLTYLWLADLPKLREWRVERGAMASLSTIRLYNCQRLEMIPDGLKFIDTLEMLSIKRMPLLEKRVSKSKDDGLEGEDYHKIRHVSSIIFE